MIQGFDIEVVIQSIIEEILNIKLLSMIIYTNSQLLYNYLMKLSSIQEKRLMVNLICLQQLYEKRKIMENRQIDGNSNPINTMTKAKPCAALKKLIDTNIISLNTTKRVKQMNGT